jgi:ABC-type multidrug transport system ATPase subunit
MARNQPTSDATDQRINGISLSAKNLSKRFNREWIFRELNYTFSPGHTYAITGPNGSGKSTLLQVLWGQVPQSSGTLKYTFRNQEIPIQEISNHVSIATPYMDLIDEFTLMEHLTFHFKLKPIRQGVSIKDLLKIVYLEHAADKPLKNFSSGMKQRVKLALAFYTQADLVFLDEPGTNLDAQAFQWYTDERDKLPAGCMLLIASNNAEEYPQNATLINMLDFKERSGGGY